MLPKMCEKYPARTYIPSPIRTIDRVIPLLCGRILEVTKGELRDNMMLYTKRQRL